jgi:hypothetical protein
MSSEQDALLTETIARHFPEARIDGGKIELGFAELTMECWVNSVKPLGQFSTASLFFNLRGGALGRGPVFASMSGYGDSEQEAIIGGGCNWACTFGPVLRTGLAGESHADVEAFEVMLDGQSYRLFIDGLDRALFSGQGGGDASERTRVARARLGGWPWLTRRIVDSGRLPLLPAGRPTILSVFVGGRADDRIVEVKVNGADWPGMDEIFAEEGGDPPGVMTMLRELAVLVPIGDTAPLARVAVARTLAGLERPQGDHRRASVSWAGWRRHAGALAAPLSAAALAQLEASVGPLPPDYRQFVAEVAAAGAGPGYGLLSPLGEAQARLARGTFAFADETAPEDGPDGVLALAHAGCGVMWFLVLGGAHAGEIWCDARSSDGNVRRVARSFTAWYRDWLRCAVEERAPWSAWDAKCCSTASVLSKFLDSVTKDDPPGTPSAGRLTGKVAPGKLSLFSGGSRWFAPKARLDPCEPCAAAAAHFGLGGEVFAPGVAPLAGTDDAPAPAEPEGGRLTRWLRRLTNRSEP